LLLLQDADDLLFAEPAALHLCPSVLPMAGLYFRLEEDSHGRSMETFLYLGFTKNDVMCAVNYAYTRSELIRVEFCFMALHQHLKRSKKIRTPEEKFFLANDLDYLLSPVEEHYLREAALTVSDEECTIIQDLLENSDVYRTARHAENAKKLAEAKAGEHADLVEMIITDGVFVDIDTEEWLDKDGNVLVFSPEQDAVVRNVRRWSDKPGGSFEALQCILECKEEQRKRRAAQRQRLH
ncbi:hypothetical protein ACM64Y_03580, partial [Novispirillum sp. DQ9]|uniref:hypothetical protein n=1 Tax=Novispirillum sp. DQ9 TaxID=3398612 RepID=UPI003C7ECAC8